MMNKKLAARLIIDLAMTILMLFSLSYRVAGDISHEWIGVSVFVLFVLHHIINRRWYRQLLKGKYD